MDFFMKYANVAFSIVPRMGDGDAENWSKSCPYLYFGLAIMLVSYFVNFR